MKDPLVVDVKRNSLDDGPGIRSVVFFKGCPLQCQWCQNPEAISPVAQLQRQGDSCIQCGACVDRCPERIARPAKESEAREHCRRCGACVPDCPTEARRIVGTRYDVAQLAEQIARDEPFFRHSNGGVTLSGGEPTMFIPYAARLAEVLRAKQIHVLLESCGHFAWQPFAEHLLPHLSAVYIDIKLADPEHHRRYTGRGNQRILDNLRNLAAGDGYELLPRVPLVPGITDDASNLEAIAALLRQLELPRVALLQYNPLWLDKRRALGLELSYEHDEWMAAERLARCREIMIAGGLEVVG